MSGATEHAVVVSLEHCPRVVDGSRVAAVRERMPDAATVQDVADAFRVLAEPARLRIVLPLLEAGELCVCDVAAAAEMSETSTSQHLRVLRASRTVRKRRDGRIAYYRSRTATFACSSTSPSSTAATMDSRTMHGPEEAAHETRPADWPAWAAWAALVAGFGGAIAAALVLGIVAVPFGGALDAPPPSVNILATVAQDASLVIAALLFARLSGRPRPADFGLRATAVWPAVGWAALTWGSFFAFTAAWVSLVGAPSNDTALPKSLGADESTTALVAVALLVCVIAPLTEEFFFRGFFFRALQSWRGVWPAALATGLVFGAIHIGSADPAYLLPLAYFGFALCALRVVTRSLYPSIGVHALNNSVAFGASQDWRWEIIPATVIALASITVVLNTVPRLWRPVAAPG